MQRSDEVRNPQSIFVAENAIDTVVFFLRVNHLLRSRLCVRSTGGVQKGELEKECLDKMNIVYFLRPLKIL